MKYATEKQILWGMIFAYIAFFSVFTSLRHYNFQTQTWDLGIFIQTFWNTIHGKIMFNNLEEVSNHLAVHLSPFLFLLIPGYAIFQSPYYLLIVQTAALALGAWPLYLLGKRLLPHTKFPILFSVGYLLYPPLHWINVFDFHEIAFLVPLLLGAFYFIEIKSWGWASVFLALAASTKEDAILIVLFLGLYFLLKSGGEKNERASWWTTHRKVGLAVILFSTSYFLIAAQVIMPALGGGLLRLDRYANLGQNAAEIITNLIFHPSLFIKTLMQIEKMRYLFWLLAPIAFLPIFSKTAVVLLIPGLLENLLTNFTSQFTGLYQYDATVIAPLFIAGLYGAKFFLKARPAKKLLLQRIIVFAIFLGFLTQSPVNPIFFPTELFKSNPHWSALRKIIRMVPQNPNLSLAAPTQVVPHLSRREHAYPLGAEPFPTDIVIIDGADYFGFKNAGDFQSYVDNYLNSGRYYVQTIENRYLLLKKK